MGYEMLNIHNFVGSRLHEKIKELSRAREQHDKAHLKRRRQKNRRMSTATPATPARPLRRHSPTRTDDSHQDTMMMKRFISKFTQVIMIVLMENSTGRIMLM